MMRVKIHSKCNTKPIENLNTTIINVNNNHCVLDHSHEHALGMPLVQKEAKEIFSKPLLEKL